MNLSLKSRFRPRPPAPQAEASKVEAATTSGDWRLKATCSGESVALFVRQLAEMFRCGVPLSQGLETLADQPQNPALSAAVAAMATDVQTGHALSAALSHFPRMFPKLLVIMVRIGEHSGGLEIALLQVASWLERDTALRKRMSSAMVYPVFVIFLTGLLTLALFTTIMPGFVRLLEGMHAKLPLVTRVMIWLTHVAVSPGAWLIGAATAGAIAVALNDYLRSSGGRRNLYTVLMRLPVVGPMVVFTAVARYSAAVHAMVITGVALDKTVLLAGEASGNPLFADDARVMVQSMHEGTLLSDHMKTRGDLYPPTMTQMTLMAEETSQIEQVYDRLARFYDQEIEYRIEVLTSMLEPAIMLAVGLAVGTVVLSVFLPMYSYLGHFGA